ncbi:uncharacterized protein [Rutidosis leptorrhynchoides]|uniref:uncharacterized protein n=1 Tax=Rutidosis leptorrhynchoides TaxID=125765 RepID=UPI003A9A5117
MPKSVTFFVNVSQHVNDPTLVLLPFDEGLLPVKYLGMPLVSSQLFNRDCKVLVDSVKNRVGYWKNKFLSFAGRVQLIISKLSSMQNYWKSVFILTCTIIKEIEAVMRGFFMVPK